jgi:hypothetical protein
MQIALVFVFTLSANILYSILLKTGETFTFTNIFRQWIWVYFIFVFAILLSLLASEVGLERSTRTLSVEILGAIFSLSCSWWFCRNIKYLRYFLYENLD